MDKSMRSLLYNPYQTVLFTPLSIRRGGGGEAVGVGGEAGWVDCRGFFFPILFA